MGKKELMQKEENSGQREQQMEKLEYDRQEELIWYSDETVESKMK